MRARSWFGVLTIGILFVTGCGGANLASVKGRVTFAGKPVNEAMITFSPIPSSETEREPGRPGTGFTDAQGLYVLSTHRNYDGAQLGKHRVTVTLDDTNPARCKREKLVTLEVKSGQNEFDIEMDAR